MGRFDGILLGTDFDMTLAIKSMISPENAAAIRYFEENGGRFTIVSGRNPVFSLEHQQDFRINAPVVGFNGALMLDPNTRQVLFEGGRNDYAMLDFLWPFYERDEQVKIMLVHYCDSDGKPASCHVDRGDGMTLEGLRERITLPLYNVILVTAPSHSAELRQELQAAAGETFVVARSWNEGIEVINPRDTKDAALLRLKEMLGCRLAVAAGDYENDIGMLRAADIGYAVDNAVPEVKEAADRITVDCREHAIAAIVRDLEKMCKNA